MPAAATADAGTDSWAVSKAYMPEGPSPAPADIRRWA